MKQLTLGIGRAGVVAIACVVQGMAATAPARRIIARVIDKSCVSCHNERVKTANLMLDKVDIANPGANPEVWEKVMRKVHTGTMPPPNMPQLSRERSARAAGLARNVARCGGCSEAESRAAPKRCVV